MTDIRLSGVPLRYHFFMELFYAILKRVFPASVFNCVFRYPILLVPPLACGSFYKLIGRKGANRIIISGLTMISLFFSDLLPGYTHMTSHIGTNINAVGFALPCAITLCFLLIRMLDNQGKRQHIADCFLIFGVGIVLTGLKGPFSMAITASCMAYSAYLWFTDKKSPFLIGTIVLSASFAIVYFLLLKTAVNHENLEEGSRFFGLIKPYINTPQILNTVTNKHLKDLLVLPCSLAYAFGFLIVPYFAALISYVMKRNLDHSEVLLIIVSLVSIGMFYLLAVAQNRVYFAMLATPIIASIATKWIFDHAAYKKKLISVLSISAFLLIISISNGVRNPKLYFGSGTLSKDDIKATRWIKQNTPEHAILSINDHSENGKQFYYSAFSERQFFIETTTYSKNSGVLASDLENRLKINDEIFFGKGNRQEKAKDLGIDYLIQVDYKGDFNSDLGAFFDQCFSSETVRIFKCSE
ncbi:MAG: hypothetical protein IJ573_05115 [Clostridia bacterium]|nr:hypothetical protein [Clostridia bacterium]